MGVWVFVVIGIYVSMASAVADSAKASTQATVLEGDWIGVVDGCEDLSASDVAHLPEAGGGNQISRGEALSFHGETFRTRMLQPSRCAADYKPTGPEILPATLYCGGGTTSGHLSIVSPDRFMIVAEQVEGADPWGEGLREFDFKLFDDSVLYVRLVESDGACENTTKRIYFIRMPMS